MPKKKKRTPLLSLYYKWCEKNEMDHAGLCSAMFEKDLQEEFNNLFRPFDYNNEVIDNLYRVTKKLNSKEFNKKHDITYWGSNSVESREYEFTELRRNMLLLYAAYKGEL